MHRSAAGSYLCSLALERDQGLEPGCPSSEETALVTKMFAVLRRLLPCACQLDTTTSQNKKPISGRV